MRVSFQEDTEIDENREHNYKIHSNNIATHDTHEAGRHEDGRTPFSSELFNYTSTLAER